MQISVCVLVSLFVASTGFRTLVPRIAHNIARQDAKTSEIKSHRIQYALFAGKPTNKLLGKEKKKRQRKVDESEPIDEEEEVDPMKAQLLEYCKRVVPSGQEIKLQQFVQYSEVQRMFKEYIAIVADVEEFWLTFAENIDQSITFDDAYQLLVMMTTLPEPGDEMRWTKAFKKLSGGSALTDDSAINLSQFMSWKEVKEIITEGILSSSEMEKVYDEEAGGVDKTIKFSDFLRINRRIDIIIDDMEDEDGDDDDAEYEDEEEVDEESGPWSLTFNPSSLFDEAALTELKSIFKQLTSTSSASLTLEAFQAWEEITELVADNTITTMEVQSLFTQATRFLKKKTLNEDGFIRLNAALELLLETKEKVENADVKLATNAKPSTSDEEPVLTGEAFYRSEFLRITGGPDEKLTLPTLLEWDEVRSLLDEQALTQQQVTGVFNSLARGAGCLDEQGFLQFNDLLDLLLDNQGRPSTNDDDAAASSPKARAVPKELVTEAPLPMPKDNAMRMLKLDGKQESDSPMTPEEQEMMEMVDQADKLLSERSFKAFDTLIGDTEDPRLNPTFDEDLDPSAPKPPRFDTKDEREAARKILSLAESKITRCGLDPVDEETSGALRAAFQNVVDTMVKSPQGPLALRAGDASNPKKIMQQVAGGKWKLLYTNSDMLAFYSGVTGLVNVFPGSKFVGLDLQYESDGYLSEAKYLEELTSPLVGSVTATVSANWEIVKETSFMTNEDALILRSYVNKVTAGPFKYDAEENWKSLRCLAMNEVVYVDEDALLIRNAGALRVFFVLKRIKD